MTVPAAEKKSEQSALKHIFIEYNWFYENIYGRLKNITAEFFNLEYSLRFMGISYNDENILFFGDEYFVNKIAVNKTASAFVRISAGLLSSILDNSLGAGDSDFSLDTLTAVEADIMKSFTLFIYNKLEGLFIKQEQPGRMIKSSKTYNFTFYAQYEGRHKGKIIISVPDYILNGNIEAEFNEDCFDISGFNKMPVTVTLTAGSAKLPLNDVKNLESGDFIVLDDSRADKMALYWNGNIVDFNVIPNPALMISIDKTGGSEMDSGAPAEKNSMWDTILVDVTAEFDNFQLTLGELKQISEGLVIDVGSVYGSRIKLKAAKQTIASGELVILNDRYGVRIDSINNPDDEPEYEEETEEEEPERSSAKAPAKKKPAQRQASAEDDEEVDEESAETEDEDDEEEGDENFDYSDFEIEDESI